MTFAGWWRSGDVRMSDDRAVGPESSAVRVALWRALHALVDAPPHVLEGEAGFRDARHVSGVDLSQRYFAGRTDGLGASRAEELLIATT